MESVGSAASDPQRQILVVEDEPGLLEELTHYLSRAGWRTEGVGDAAEAQRVLNRDRGFTVLLTDIRLPGMNGLALARSACAGRGDADAMEVVLLTGHGTMDDAVEALRLGAFDFIRKPLSLSALRTVVERAHDSAAQRRAAEADRANEIGQLRQQQALLKAALATRSDALDFRGSVPHELSGLFAHEIRAQLVALLAVPDLLGKTDDLPTAEVLRHLGIAREAGRTLARIAGDFVEFIDPKDPNVLDFAPTSPECILQRVHAKCKVAAAKGRHTINVVCTAGGTIDTDPTWLACAMQRLVANATAWCPFGAEISLVARDNGDHVVFAVSDNGPGLTMDEIAKAREPAGQIGVLLSRRIGGIGLGLLLAGRAARTLGGDLIVESSASGTSASFILPRHASPCPVPAPRA